MKTEITYKTKAADTLEIAQENWREAVRTGTPGRWIVTEHPDRLDDPGTYLWEGYAVNAVNALNNYVDAAGFATYVLPETEDEDFGST